MATQPHGNDQTAQDQDEGPRLPKANGYCHHCTIRVDDNVVFCEPRCEQFWRAEQRKG